MMRRNPGKQGLYDPRNEHVSCGVGFIADVLGRRSHQIVQDGLQILANLAHRAVGADPLIGDGAVCLIQIPDGLLRNWAEENAVGVPEAGRYAVAMCFLSRDEEIRSTATAQLERFVQNEGQIFLG